VSIESKSCSVIKVESEVQPSQIRATGRESYRTFNFVFEAQAATEKLHCGLAYYQVPAIKRSTVKLNNYPVVVANQSAFNSFLKLLLKNHKSLSRS